MDNQTRDNSSSDNFTLPFSAEITINLGSTPYFLAEICLAIIAFIGNTFTLSAFVFNRKLRTISHLYIASLAISDFCMGALGIPIILLALVGLPKNYGLCMANLTFFLLLDFCSIYSLLALTFDRYYAVCWPLHYNAHMTWSRAGIILGVAWFIPLIFALIMPLGWNYGDPDAGGCIFLDLVSLDYLTFNFFTMIIAPFFLMCWMYILMFRVIQKQLKEIALIHNIGQISNNRGNGTGTDNTETQDARVKFDNVKRERKTALLFGLLLVFFVVTWGPIFLIDTLLYFGVLIDQFYINFAVALSHFNSAFNPVIYCLKSEFRNTYKRWLRYCCNGFGRVEPEGSRSFTSATEQIH